MILNQKDLPEIYPNIIHLFEDDLSVRAVLTGSRYFGDATPASDWDLVVDIHSKPHIHDWLFDLGFLQESGNFPPYGDDPHLVEIWTLTAGTFNPQVHIQLTGWLEHRWEMQRNIKSMFLGDYLMMSKPQRKSLWKLLWATWSTGQYGPSPIMFHNVTLNKQTITAKMIPVKDESPEIFADEPDDPKAYYEEDFE